MGEKFSRKMITTLLFYPARKNMKFHLIFVSICFFFLVTILASCNFTGQSSTGVELSKIPSTFLVWHARWSPDGNKIALYAEKNRDPTFPGSLYIYNLLTNETTKIPLEAENLSPLKRFSTGEVDWSPDGTKLALFGQPMEKPDLTGIWILDLNDYSMKRISNGETMSWSPDGKRIAVIETQPLTHSQIKIITIQNHEEKTVYQFDHKDDWGLEITWSASGEDLVVSVPETTSDGYATKTLYRLNLKDSSFVPLFGKPRWSMDHPDWLPNGNWIVFIAQSSKGGTVAVAPITGECLFAWLPKIKEADFIDVTPDGKKALVISSGDLYIVDLEKAVDFSKLPDQLKCR